MKHWTAAIIIGVLVLSCLAVVVCLRGVVGSRTQPAQAQAPTPPAIPESLELPQYEMPEPNGYAELEALLEEQDEGASDALQLQKEFYRKHPGSPSEASLQQAREAMVAYQDAFDALPDLLEMEWLYPRRQTPASIYPELGGTRWLVRALGVRSVVEEQDGDPDRAAQTLLDAMALAVKLPRGGAIYGSLTGRACEAIAQTELRPLVASGALSGEALRSVLDTMEALEPQRIPLREAIAFDYDAQGPGALTLDAKEFWELLGGPPNTFLPLDDPEADKLARQFIIDRLPPLVAYDAELAELSTQPFWHVAHALPEVPDELPDPGDGQTLMFQAVPPKMLQTAALRDCDWLATELMVRLELARLATGEYPDALTDLDGIADEDVVDPLTGVPLVYGRAGESYVLYSISLDGVDNGGEMGENYMTQFEEGGDFIIWDGRAE